MPQSGGELSKMVQLMHIIDGGLGAKPPAAGRVLQFFEKKKAILTPFGSHFERFFKPFKRITLNCRDLEAS